MEQLVSLLVGVIILALILGLVWWAVGLIGVPEPFGKIIRAALVIIMVIVLIYMLLQVAGGHFPVLRVR